MHKLTIKSDGKNTKMYLDSFELDGVCEYKITRCAKGVTRIVLKMMVKEFETHEDDDKLNNKSTFEKQSMRLNEKNFSDIGSNTFQELKDKEVTW